MNYTSQIQFRRTGEWTGIYLNGKLVHHGDHCTADDWLQGRFGVVVVDDPAGHWLVNDKPVVSLTEVEERAYQARLRQQDADAKRAEARRLIAEAEALEMKR